MNTLKEWCYNLILVNFHNTQEIKSHWSHWIEFIDHLKSMIKKLHVNLKLCEGVYHFWKFLKRVNKILTISELEKSGQEESDKK